MNTYGRSLLLLRPKGTNASYSPSVWHKQKKTYRQCIEPSMRGGHMLSAYLQMCLGCCLLMKAVNMAEELDLTLIWTHCFCRTTPKLWGCLWGNPYGKLTIDPLTTLTSATSMWLRWRDTETELQPTVLITMESRWQLQCTGRSCHGTIASQQTISDLKNQIYYTTFDSCCSHLDYKNQSFNP